MKALLPCAGPGARLWPLTNNQPKCLVPIHGKPLPDYRPSALTADSEILEISIKIHHYDDLVGELIDANPSRNKIPFIYEGEALGIAGLVPEKRIFFEESPFFLVPTGKHPNATRASQSRNPTINGCSVSGPKGSNLWMLHRSEKAPPDRLEHKILKGNVTAWIYDLHLTGKKCIIID